jgi:phage terminase large subunit
MTCVVLPYGFNPRAYQRHALRKALIEKKKRDLWIWHRRAGKDLTALNKVNIKAFERVGAYFYLLPELTQAKRVIWKGIDGSGKRFLDYIPRQLIKDINNTEMRVEYINGSILQMGGSDRYDYLMGTNPVGIIMSEYSLQNPLAWNYLRPILTENEGWATFIYTPRGQNHGYELYQNAINDDEWHVDVKTVNDTFRNDGTPVITPEKIEKERRAGMPEELIEQEFYCSFTSGVPGAYYAKQLKQAYDEKRIFDFPIEKSLPVFTWCDIGVGDSTSIILVQPFRNELRLIASYENCGEGMEHYVNWLNEFAIKNGIKYARHFAPHDMAVREFSTGKSRQEAALKLGIRFEIVPNIPIDDGIQAVRNIFPRLYIHQTNNKHWLACIQNYQKVFNDKHRIFSTKPLHDWSSHMADATRYFAVSWQEYFMNTEQLGVREAQRWSITR